MADLAAKFLQAEIVPNILSEPPQQHLNVILFLC